MESIWNKTVEIPNKKSLAEDIHVKNVVIGAGMAGILTAWSLMRRGQEVIVLEANEIGSGQSGYTTAKITSQHGLFYDRMIRLVGKEAAREYAVANEQAIRHFEKIVQDENIDCHFESKPAYLYTLQQTGVEPLYQEAAAARSLGIDAVFLSGNEITELPFSVTAAVRFERQAQFHPLEFMKHLANELTIYEHTKVLSVTKHRVYTADAAIQADNIIFATHYPILNVPGFYFVRQHQEKSYVLALAKQPELTGMYYNIDSDGLSLRSEGDVLLLGGGGHRTGKCLCKEKKGEPFGYSFLIKQAETYYPDADIICHWSAQDCMPHDRIPFIGKYSVFRPYWYVATGFKKWGMTSSMVAAQMISNQICGVTHSEYPVFRPQRLFIRAGIKNFLMDVGESMAGLTKGLFAAKNQRCRHMGCKLSLNPEEAVWECSCHGSSFYEDGRLKNNPSKKDLTGSF